MTTLAFIGYFLSIFYILKKEPLVIILYFFMLFNQTTNYISVFYLDKGDIYMRELGTYSIPAITSLYVWLFNMIALITIFSIIHFNKSSIRQLVYRVYTIHISNLTFWIGIFYIIIIILIINVLISGSPLWVESINKTTFWNIAKFKFFKPLSSQISIIALFCGMFLVYNDIHYKSKTFKWSLRGIWVLILLYMILMGHKFGQLLIITYMFFLPLLVYKILLEKLSFFKLSFQFFSIVSIFFILVVNYFKTKYGDYALEIIQQRIFSMEGQLTYTAILNYINNEIPSGLNQFFTEIKFIFGLTDNTNVGMNYLMNQTMPQNLLEAYEATDVKLAQGYIAMLLYLFNSILLAIPIHILFILLYGFISYFLLKSILRFDFIMTFLYLKLYFSFATYYAQAYTTAIFNIKNLIYIFIIILVYFNKKIAHQRKRQSLETITHH